VPVINFALRSDPKNPQQIGKKREEERERIPNPLELSRNLCDWKKESSKGREISTSRKTAKAFVRSIRKGGRKVCGKLRGHCWSRKKDIKDALRGMKLSRTRPYRKGLQKKRISRSPEFEKRESGAWGDANLPSSKKDGRDRQKKIQGGEHGDDSGSDVVEDRRWGVFY